MPKINVLDKHTAELIAAGEVVERPSSAIKELCENSIDAKAKHITVEIKNGGISYMRITDDGCGIARDDVPKAFLRHATSKVKTAEDLNEIGTLGFRGEALASISAVSKVELITREEDELAGTSYRIDGGEEVSCEDTGCPKGTTIIVRDLFYNVPARMKFLKRDIAEGNSVSAVIDKIALSHPEIAISFIRDGRKVLSTPGDGKLMSAIYAVFGRDFAKELISVEYKMYGITVSGYISKPTAARPTRNMQNFFLNGRFVKSRTAMASLEEACKGSVMVGKYPSCVLNIEMSCKTYDVNVHPAKLEVRFTNERPLFDCIYHAVKTALLNCDENKEIKLNTQQNRANPFEFIKTIEKSKQPVSPIADTAQKNTEKAENSFFEPEIFIPKKPIKTDLSDGVFAVLRDSGRTEYNPSVVNDASDSERYTVTDYDVHEKPESKNESLSEINEQEQHSDNTHDKSIPDLTEKKSVSVPVIAQQTEIEEINCELKYIGEAFDTYIILQKGNDELLLIDKHAAHERLIYEKLKKQTNTFAQILLTPVSVVLSKEEYTAVIENEQLLLKAGYEIDDFGQGTVIVRSAPQYLSDKEIADSVIEIAGYLVNNRSKAQSEKAENIFHTTACRAAVKGGNKSTTEELIALVKQLELNPEVRYCPHGRPITTVIKKRELEKQFGRIQ